MTTEQILKLMSEDKAVRRTIVKRSHKFFFYYYFQHYVEFAIAPFQEELFHLSENDTHSMLVVSAFRGSGKSTLLSLSYVLWSIINRRTKFALVISSNHYKAKVLLDSIKSEFVTNELFRNDFGPFKEDGAIWNAVSLVLTNYNAKITALSTEQSVRGLRHLNHRPDLIIVDDSETQESVKTIESRDKLYQWLTGDVVPAGTSKTRLIVIGSILHADGLIMRLQKQIDAKAIDGTYRMYPIHDDEGNSLWPSRFPDMEAMLKEKARGVPDREWKIEYLLKPPSDEDQIVRDHDIQYYDRLPEVGDDTYLAVDLAISQASTADYTAMVSGVVVRTSDSWQLHILPYPINERLNGPEIQERILSESKRLGNGHYCPVTIESVAFQQFLIDIIRQNGVPVTGFSPSGSDKRARLTSVSSFIQSGQVRFPKKGAELLLNQVLYFGTERHDDLLDALVMLILTVFEREDQNRILIPKPYEQLPAPSQEEAEHEADEMISLLQEATRGNQYALNRYNELEQKHRKEHWDNEALRGYDALMRDSIRHRRGGY